MALVEITNPFSRYALLTLNLPEKRNPLTAELVRELKSALTDIANNEKIKIAAITGGGSAFCAGADLAGLKKLRDNSPEENIADSRSLADLFEMLWNFPKPLIGLINGSAIAGGMGLLTTLDYCIAADNPNALFGFSEVRIGFVPAIVSNFLLRKIPGATARWLLISGELFDVHRAKELGLIQDVCLPDELLNKGAQLAEKLIGQNSLTAMISTKKLLNRISETDLSEGIDIAVSTNAEARSTDSCKAGIDAFLNKEKIDWREKD